MSKIVKYCNSCEEGFASKFGFCPNCGKELQAFQMNPVNTAPPAAAPVETPRNEFIAPAETPTENTTVAEPEPPPVLEVPEVNEIPAAAPLFIQPEAVKPPAVISEPLKAEQKPVAPVENIVEPISTEQTAFAGAPVIVDEPKEIETPPVEAPKTRAAAAAGAANTGNPPPTRIESEPKTSNQTAAYIPDQGFYVTVIDDKNVKQRNVLLLGSLAFIITLVAGATVYSLFSQDMFVGAIDQGDFISSVPDLVPAPVDEIPPPKKDNKPGGGGGGGGKEQQEDPAKGRLPPQIKDPITPPDPNIPTLTNPELKEHQATKGNNPRPVTDETTGLPTGLSYNGSSGRGKGGGIGNGFGTGAGNGRGEGEGNGIGSGSGDGIGNGQGNNRGDGGNNKPPPPPAAPPVQAGPSKPLKILSNPKPPYTDEARKNQVTGTVVLRVTFLASGQIGSISTVSGLPNGLTEQAIAAARNIRFEPLMKNGVAQTTVKQMNFSFTIY